MVEYHVLTAENENPHSHWLESSLFTSTHPHPAPHPHPPSLLRPHARFHGKGPSLAPWWYHSGLLTALAPWTVLLAWRLEIQAPVESFLQQFAFESQRDWVSLFGCLGCSKVGFRARNANWGDIETSQGCRVMNRVKGLFTDLQLTRVPFPVSTGPENALPSASSPFPAGLPHHRPLLYRAAQLSPPDTSHGVLKTLAPNKEQLKNKLLLSPT